MDRFVVANLTCLAVLVAAATLGSVASGWPWWATLLTAVGAFFGGGLLVERIAPGTRLLRWLGWNGSR